MTQLGRHLVFAWAVAVTAVAARAAAAPEGVSVVKAEPAPAWDARFAGKEGWIGGDGVYSVVLGPRRVLWLFGDTLMGTAKDGRRTGAVMVNNTVGLQAGTGTDVTVQFVTGKTKDGKPAALFTPAAGKGWFWPQGAIRVGDRLFTFMPNIEKTTDEGAFGFRHVSQWLAVVENPDDHPAAWRVKQHKVPFTEFGSNRERSWGSAVLADGGNLFVYGYVEQGKGLGKRRLTVARMPAEKLADFEAWRFLTPNGWSNKPIEAAPLADGLATEFSVSRRAGTKGFVMVYTENGLGERIVGRFARSPEGPWSAPVLLYTCPEMAKDKGLFTYAAKAHAWAVTGDELLISYCVNAHAFARLFSDDKVYLPKFVRVELAPK